MLRERERIRGWREVLEREAAREAMQRFLEWLDALAEQERSGETLAQVQAA